MNENSVELKNQGQGTQAPKFAINIEEASGFFHRMQTGGWSQTFLKSLVSWSKLIFGFHFYYHS